MWSLLCSVYKISEVGAMIVKKFLKKVALVIGLVSMCLGLIHPNATYAEAIEETVDTTFEYGWGYNESENEAKMAALDGAKRRAIEQVFNHIDGNPIVVSKEAVNYIITNCMSILDEKTSLNREKRICKVSIVAKVKIDMLIEATAEYRMGYNDTRQQAEERALTKAKQKAIEKIIDVVDSFSDEVKISCTIVDKKISWDPETNTICTVSIIEIGKIDTGN